jgi:GDPmannose 4,6-dehydratase
MQWRMLQQEAPEDFVIATGVQYSVRDFVDSAANELGVTIRWEGTGHEEVGIVDTINSDQADNKFEIGKVVVRVDPRYFRPTEVETLLGNPAKAKEKLGWTPKISFNELVVEMMRCDLEEAKKDQLCKSEGFSVFNRYE